MEREQMITRISTHRQLIEEPIKTGEWFGRLFRRSIRVTHLVLWCFVKTKNRRCVVRFGKICLAIWEKNFARVFVLTSSLLLLSFYLASRVVRGVICMYLT